MTESITVNGVDLATFASRVEDFSGLWVSPATRGDDLLVPGRHGAVQRADAPYDPGLITLPIWLKGVDPATGALVPGTTVADLRARVDEMSKLFNAPTLTIDHEVDGQVRRATGHLVRESTPFTRERSSPAFARFTATIAIPAAFWFDPTTVTSGPHSLVTGGTVDLTGFAGATAPMADLQITFTGPISNPELHQTATGSFVAYDGVIASGQTLTVHCDDTIAAPLVGTGGLTPNYTLLRYKPPRWFELNPSAGLTVELRHTGGGSAAFTVVGNRRFLTG